MFNSYTQNDDTPDDDTQTTTFSTQDASTSDSQSACSIVHSTNKRQKKVITSADVLQQYLDKKEEVRDIRESSQSNNDHIRQFFVSSEAIYRMLPAEVQVDARVEITQLLANYEKQVLMKRKTWM